ncbi:MAG: TetR/AcrR family transcriptional regulator [Hyphomonadaceae bacterium]|nr:MAG: TetR family transcriptional regulator [Caulobacteraceae bacterium]MBT9445681.1 TetR/AcrR family transcriptional regulator [Hyphomonadaceae bacterium]TPW08328.1 MAG: TetR family transcriptional regulator [Alphaproteobacteria bacterium]
MALSSARREARRSHIVAAAQSLLRERGDAGFSMTELAARAQVSPATPYNLVGTKADLLRLVVQEEFASFTARLATRKTDSPVRALLDATTLVVAHYEADPAFYRALYGMMFVADAPDVHDLMQTEGRALWRTMVRAAVDCGELAQVAGVEPLTDVILRTIGANTLAWLSEDWSRQRFEAEMSLSIRLMLASVARADIRAAMLREIERLPALLRA